jgi:hypothetical protein
VGEKEGGFEGGGSEGWGMEYLEYEGGGTDEGETGEGVTPKVKNVLESKEQASVTAGSWWNLLPWKDS